MNFIKQTLQDVWVIEPKLYGDHRGYFTETFRKDLFEQHIGPVNFIQDNESKSSFGVFRGLHYQTGEYVQAKLVRVLKGSVIDIIVDLRQDSPTYGQHLQVELSEENKRQLFVPRGFAHGFIVTSEEAVFSYKVDNTYSPAHEACICYSDPALQIALPLPSTQVILSDKDKLGLTFAEAPKF